MTTNPKPTDPREGMTSASNAQADLLCPGRHQAQAGLPDKRTEWGETGDRIHAALANSENKVVMQSLSAEERDTFDRCREIEKRLVAAFFGDFEGNGNRVFRHERFWVKVPLSYGVRYPHSGEADVVFRRGPKALILDYKTLYGDVPESPHNLQLRDLAVLVSGSLLVEEIGVAIIQPAVTDTPEVCLYDREALNRAAAEMFARVLASHAPNAPRIAGEFQCKFCRAKLHCVEHQKAAGSMLPAITNLVDVPVASWTPEQRASFCERRLLAQKWLDDCVEEMKRLLKEHKANVPGWFLKPGAVREGVVNPQEVFNRFVALGGKPEDFVSNCVSVQKGELRQAVSAVTGAKGKSLEQAMETLLNGCTSSKQNAPSLAREDE